MYVSYIYPPSPFPSLPASDMWQSSSGWVTYMLLGSLREEKIPGSPIYLVLPKFQAWWRQSCIYKRVTFLIIIKTIFHSSKYLNSYEGLRRVWPGKCSWRGRPSSVPQNLCENLGAVVCALIPALWRQRKEGSLGLLASWPSLLGEFRSVRDFVLRERWTAP